MAFFKTTNNTNGLLQIPNDMDTITLRNIAIANASTQQTTLLNTTLIPYDTIALRNIAIGQQTIVMNTTLIPYDTIALRNSAISTIFTSNNIFSGINYFINTVVRGSFARSTLSINSSITLPSSILCNYFCINGINPIIITLSIASDSGTAFMIRRGIGSTGTITISFPTIYPFNSNISVSSVIINNSSDFVFFENGWYQKSNF